jgi:hypothetical protein
MLGSAKERAAKKGLPFSLTKDDIAIPSHCPILGVPLKRGTKCFHDYSPSLDRIIPELGYVPGNIQVISHRANRIKTDANPEEVMLVAQYMSSIQSTSQTA